MKKKAFFVVLSVWFLLAGLGCVREETFPDEPVLRMKSLVTTSDSAIIVFEFTDGDGNFGLSQRDTTGIFGDCLRRYNVYCEYYELQNGDWVHFPIDPCINPNAVPFYYRVPFVEPTGQIKSQKGEIKIVITPFYYFPGPFDTCRFQIQAIDRNMNLSNVIVTPSFRKS